MKKYPTDERDLCEGADLMADFGAVAFEEETRLLKVCTA